MISSMNDGVVVTEIQSERKDSIRSFLMSVSGVSVELCSLGASITRFLVPTVTTGTSTKGPEDSDDIVLGYASPNDMRKSENPVYFGAVVGRVANRIAKGILQIEDKDGRPTTHQLAINNDPNHLHGGVKGFSHRLWDGSIVNLPVESDLQGNDKDDGENKPTTKAVQFSLLSHEGDQAYPGAVEVTATYSLRPAANYAATENNGISVKLYVELKARLQGDTPTPVNLAQHSYWNLFNHSSPDGILDHSLVLNCEFYTPVDQTSIPTREVLSLSEDPVMNWRKRRKIGEALVEYGVAKAGLTAEAAKRNVRISRVSPDIGICKSGSPYGFDHNYVVNRDSHGSNSNSNNNNENTSDRLYHVGTLEHEPCKRRLNVWTDAPGVQIYTANYLDGSLPSEICKDGAVYGQWQGLCLETQHFPDSIKVDNEIHHDFATGKCCILNPAQPDYRHRIVYHFECNQQQQQKTRREMEPTCSSFFEEDDGPEVLRGRDSEGRRYASVDEMWEAQGVISPDGARRWYERAAQSYRDNCEPTIDGMLGGFAEITDVDLDFSRQFVSQLRQLRPSLELSAGAACECGAGIGRVTKGLLLSLGVMRCDLVEASADLLCASPDYLGIEMANKCRFFCSGLQDWEPRKNEYSLIWIQWVLCYLTDDDVVKFLKRCGDSLIPGGIIILKENSCDEMDFEVDVDDASVTRSLPYLTRLIQRSGLQVVLKQLQTNFPLELYPVPMLALEVKP